MKKKVLVLGCRVEGFKRCRVYDLQVGVKS
jgi:hypothetical protein